MQNVFIIIGVVVIGGLAALFLLNNNDTANVTLEDDVVTTQETETAPDPTPAQPNDQVTATEPEPAEQEPDIVDTAIASDDFDTLVAAVTAAGLVDTLKSEGPFTVFAPTDAAFAELPDGTVDTLLEPANVGELASVLTYHVVPSAVLSGELSDGMTVETVNGETLTIGVTADGVTVNDATVTTADIETSNGVVHVIDSVLLPSTE